ncbi:CDP-alcohol phosphatidyltransferase family protein [Amycolatopsis pithecellobii]|uniref:CDP-alcohol phosphatidyltransferase family protein n=1 Tax=Amycolatopsis pithecellobii TaxID=664692 RepID=A0A6N7YT93_9PSEU|nr:CDP-alcohol phosphatidyltransferase family protein [Amycolatopsis pithecellobii]MTD56257.1 CDP-alcohol phosphatidyltransferase family protein [Amycolatopsis pithecellobii]
MITRAEYSTVPAGQELAAGLAAQILLLAGLGALAGLGPAGWLTGSVFGAALWALLTSATRRSRSSTLGPADLVTLARAVLVGGVAALVVDRAGTAQPVALFVTLASVALVLDGVDGQVARRTGTTSALGARFDMEVDAFLILVLSVQVALAHGLWVLAIGAMRYAFVAAAWAMPWLGGALPPSFARKTVAALQGIVLVVAASGVLPLVVTVVVTACALALLTWSFGRDVHWLWRHRQARASDRFAQASSIQVNGIAPNTFPSVLSEASDRQSS